MPKAELRVLRHVLVISRQIKEALDRQTSSDCILMNFYSAEEHFQRYFELKSQPFGFKSAERWLAPK
jgi:hypothetical protein